MNFGIGNVSMVLISRMKNVVLENRHKMAKNWDLKPNQNGQLIRFLYHFMLSHCCSINRLLTGPSNADLKLS